MEQITESALAEFVANGAVKTITLQEREDGGFETLVTMLWSGDKVTQVVTKKRQVKVWSSLDRLVQHLSRFEPLPELKVVVNKARKHGQARAGGTKAG